MTPYVQSVRSSQLEQLAKQSYIDCHCFGVDSIMFEGMVDPLVNKMHGRVRAFVATEYHQLYLNTPGSVFSVGFHGHHCNVTLVPGFGDPLNVTTELSMSGLLFTPYRYTSPITTGKPGKFVLDPSPPYKFNLQYAGLGPRTFMAAPMRHTVWVEKYKTAGWFVVEGFEDPTYEPLCWSNDDLTTCPLEDLYKPMSVTYLEKCLKALGIMIVRQ